MKETSIIQNFSVFDIQLSHSCQIASKNENNDFFGPIHNRSQINDKFDWLFKMFLYRELSETVITVLFTKSKKKKKKTKNLLTHVIGFSISSLPHLICCLLVRSHVATLVHPLTFISFQHTPSFILVVNKYDLLSINIFMVLIKVRF